LGNYFSTTTRNRKRKALPGNDPQRPVVCILKAVLLFLRIKSLPKPGRLALFFRTIFAVTIERGQSVSWRILTPGMATLQ
jgi:hypothetical protein